MIQNLKFNETDRYTTSPQTRFSFMGTLNYDVTDKLHFNASGRFAQSRTETYLGRNTLTNGWETTISYNARTDSPINPTLTLTQPIINAILQAPGASFRGVRQPELHRSRREGRSTSGYPGAGDAVEQPHGDRSTGCRWHAHLPHRRNN